MLIHTMGTVASLRLPTAAPPGLDDRVVRILHDIEQRFSMYLPQSEASRVALGLVPIEGASQIFRETYDLAMQWQRDTGGAFNPWRPDGRLDLTGVVKAMAIESVGNELRELGLIDWCLNIGGDILVDGRVGDGNGAGRPWVSGIADPDDRSRVISAFTHSPGLPAIATSGVSERGNHIWTQPGADLLQVSVAASDIITADALATAILAGGEASLQAMCKAFDIAVLAVRNDRSLLATHHFHAQTPQEAQ